MEIWPRSRCHRQDISPAASRTDSWWDIPDAAPYGGRAGAGILRHVGVQRGNAKLLIVNDADQIAPDSDGLSCGKGDRVERAGRPTLRLFAQQGPIWGPRAHFTGEALIPSSPSAPLHLWCPVPTMGSLGLACGSSSRTPLLQYTAAPSATPRSG